MLYVRGCMDVWKSLTLITDYFDTGPTEGHAWREESHLLENWLHHSHPQKIRLVAWQSIWFNGSPRSLGSNDGKECIYATFLNWFGLATFTNASITLYLDYYNAVSLKNMKNLHWYKKTGGVARQAMGSPGLKSLIFYPILERKRFFFLIQNR